MVTYTICRKPPRVRYLPLRYAEKTLSRGVYSGAAVEPEELRPGEERLYSFYEPPLAAGLHTIRTLQTVEQEETSLLPLENEQSFTVDAPRYALPDGSIHSVYPPQGHAENVEILPHVVFKDPHLPWTRKVRDVKDPVGERNRVPWLALLVFTQEELRLPSLDIFERLQSGQNRGSIQQSNTLAVSLSLGDLSTVKCATPMLQPTPNRDLWDGDTTETKADFIFVPKSLFGALFKSYHGDQQTEYDVSTYQWLAHMRHINTIGMANSGIDGEEGSFGVVISPRTGPLDVSEPTDLVVHLVSIEKIPDLQFPVAQDRVALCSLDSWTYTCLPPNSFNVYDGFRHLGRDLKLLRIDAAQVQETLDLKKPQLERLRNRLDDGYVLTQYRTQTGEETVAWTRGPFVPHKVAHVRHATSHSGTELQIIDSKTGIMDVTYGVAWQLGKALALADQGFATALGRLRLVISRTATNEAKKTILRRAGIFQDRQEVLRSLADSVTTLKNLHPDRLMKGPDARWRSGPSISLDLSHRGALMQQHFSKQVGPVVKHLASSTTKDEAYSELNTPLSPDWMVFLSWVLDRMYLSGIPAHYFLPDPAYLPVESIRFFHIDRNWVDALVDGALSIANHLPNDDTIPSELKNKINDFLEQKPEGLTYPPQRPGYGFLLRSELCVKFPDLIVEAYANGDPNPDPTLILRQENIAEGILLVMFDKKPGERELEKLILREPPHEQAFSAGAALKPDHINVAYKKIFTIPLSEQENLEKENLEKRTTPFRILTHEADGTYFENPDQKQIGEPIFVWEDGEVNVHALRLPAYAERVHKELTASSYMKNYYKESGPTATLMGIQLNHPMFYLEIGVKSVLFPTMSHLSGDDGNLSSLKWLDPPNRVSQHAESLTKIQRPPPNVAPIDWHASFVAFPETPTDRLRDKVPTSVLPAPHVRRLARIDVLAAQAYESGSEPFMNYAVSPLTDLSRKNKIVRLPIKQDLVFSVHRKEVYQYQLLRIEIDIPYGKATKSRSTLIDHYDGPGATMIRDFRFNVVSSLNHNLDIMTMTVMPRARKAELNDTENLSFMLSGITVFDYNDWEHPDAYVHLAIREFYDGRVPSTANCVLHLTW